MRKRPTTKIARTSLGALVLLLAPVLRAAQMNAPTCNVKTYGATGRKADDATPAIQKAMEACAKAGGGMVYLPAGEYTSGTIYLRSHVRLYLESGATLYASPNPTAFDKEALLYGENLD